MNLTTLTKTTNSIASGTAYKGFIWEDFNVDGRLYFVTIDGNVWCLPTPASASTCWKTKPVATGTVAAAHAERLAADGWAARTARSTS